MSKKTLYFDSYCGFDIAAAVENGKLIDFSFEKINRTSIIGNIYKGKVESVLPGMQAAFINCGLERNCYLSADDVFPDSGKYEGENSFFPAFPELKEGDEIIVQVVKAPINKKGARVTCFPSFIGKNLIYMPNTPFVGVSRKITDEELRKNLIFSANRMKETDEGLIFRTAAPYAKRDELEVELGYLRNLYTSVMRSAENAKSGTLLYSDINLPMRVMRDTLIFDVERINVGCEKLEKLLTEVVRLYPSANLPKVAVHNSGRDMFDEFGLSKQVAQLTSPRVELENGAYLVIEKTEALTVVDVNTGKFTGDDSLEQTVYYTNILAAREIARQVRLRNIGGIVVVDFIDMTNPAHGKSIVEELERALKRDKTKCTVSKMSQFGLVEFTRKRTGGSPVSLMTIPCRHCHTGYTLAPRYVILGIRAKLLNLCAEGARRIKIDVSAHLLTEMTDWHDFLKDLKQTLKGAEVYCEGHYSYGEELVRYHTDEFIVNEKTIKLV